MQRLGLMARGYAEPFRRPPGGRRQHHALAQRSQDREHGAKDGRLPGPRSARHHEDLLCNSLMDRLLLFSGERHPHPAAGPRDGG